MPVTSVFNIICPEISLLQRNPFLLKYCRRFSSISAYDTPHLFLLIDTEENTEVVKIPKQRMTAIGTFHNSHGARAHQHRVCEGLPPAVIRPVGKSLMRQKRLHDLSQKALIIYIPTRLPISLWCPLFRAQKKIIHGNHAAPQFFLQLSGKCRFPCTASSINRNPHWLPSIFKGLNSPQDFHKCF